MTKTVALLPDRCPFCSEHLIEVPETKVCHRYWEHPEGECYLWTETVSDFQIERWNTRTQTDQQLREALAEFVAWGDRVQDGENGVNYLNGEKPPFGNGDDAWVDLDALLAKTRSSLSSSSLSNG